MAAAVVGALLVGMTLGLLGSGGAILTTPILAYLLGHPEKQAVAESLAVVGAIALVGAAQGAARRLVDWRSVVYFGLPGMLGAALGAHGSRWVSGAAQLALLGVVMVTASVLMLRPPKMRPADPSAPPVKTARARLAAQGVGVGAITGLVGVGGGFLIVPALATFNRLPMRRAAATSLAIICLNSWTGFGQQLIALRGHGMSVDWSVIAVFALVGAAGSLVGTFAATRLDQALLRKIFAVFLLVLAGYILWQQGAKLAGAHAGAPPAAGAVQAP